MILKGGCTWCCAGWRRSRVAPPLVLGVDPFPSPNVPVRVPHPLHPRHRTLTTTLQSQSSQSVSSPPLASTGKR